MSAQVPAELMIYDPETLKDTKDIEMTLFN